MHAYGGETGKNFLAGVGAGVVEAVLAVTPMESIKTVTIEKNLGLLPAVRLILQESGPAGLYKGATATILKQSSNQGLRFMFFNKFKELALGDDKQREKEKGGGGKLSPQVALLGGMLAGCFSTCLNNPFDMVKTRMQGTQSARYASTLDCFRQVLAKEGVLAFYSGVLPRLGRSLTD